MQATAPLPATAALERVWRDLGRPPRPLAGLGAIAYALPGMADRLVPALGEGVDRACALPDDTLAFFFPARWPSCRPLADSLAVAVQSPAEVAEVRGGVDAVLSALWSFLDDLGAAVVPAPAPRAFALDEPSGRVAR